MKYDSIIVFGAPYAGKGEQCERLGRLPGYFHFSTGEMFRSLDSNTSIGARVKDLIDCGNLVQDADLMELTKEFILNNVRTGKYTPDAQLLLLDGLPRTIAQVPFVSEIAEVKQVIYLYGGNRNDLISRAQERFKKKRRIDDSDLEKIKRRLDTYFRETNPVLEFYPFKIRATIDSTGPANVSEEQLEQRLEEIHQDILRKIVRKK